VNSCDSRAAWVSYFFVAPRLITGAEKLRGTPLLMDLHTSVVALDDSQLLASTHELLVRSSIIDAEFLIHLSEIDARKLYAARSYSSMFAFCVGALHLSEDATCTRIAVMRAMHRFPVVLECIRTRSVHLTGLRLLEPHLTEENHRDVLAEATGKSKRDIEELVARLAPRPPVPDSIRKLPPRAAPAPELPAASTPPPPTPINPVYRPPIQPLAPDSYKVELTADRALRDKLKLAQDLMRHRVPNGNLSTILDLALDLLIDEVKKERFGDGRKPRASPVEQPQEPATRHIPAAVSRPVVERDGYQCTFVDEETGRRCDETGWLELDHLDGYARTHEHSVDSVAVRCRTHNQYAADLMYGREFMDRKRFTRPGTDTQPRLL
jgi:hypothetical protein